MNASVDSRCQLGKKEAFIQQRLPSISELITSTSTAYSSPAPPLSTQPSTSFPSSISDPSQAYCEVVEHLTLQEPHWKLSYTARKGSVALSGKAPRLSVTTQLKPPSIPETKPHAQTLALAPAMEIGESYTSEAFPQAQMPSHVISPGRDPPCDCSTAGNGKHTHDMDDTTDSGRGTDSAFATKANSKPCSYEESLSRVSHQTGEAGEGQATNDFSASALRMDAIETR